MKIMRRKRDFLKNYLIIRSQLNSLPFNMQQVIITKGLPGSGKTEWSLKKIEKHQGQWKRVNKDDLRNMMDGGAWSAKKEKTIIKARNALIQLYLKEGFSVIVDDTNFEPVHLKTIEIIAGEIPVSIQDFTDVPVEECIRNDLKKTASVGKDVIMKMSKKYVETKVITPYEAPFYNNSLPDCIIVDIDGTIAHSNGRSPYDYSKVDTDTPDDNIILLINSFIAGQFESGGDVEIIFLSGREDSCEKATISWILAYTGIRPSILHMRKTEDTREDSIIKREIYEEHIKGKYNVLFVLDDRDRVVKMWREQGLKCLQVQEGNF